MTRISKGLIGLAAVLLLSSAPAFAQFNYGTFNGTNISFGDVTETSSSGDPDNLYGAPLVVGDQLLFFPANYSASAAGAFGIDQTNQQLQTTITATTGTLTTISITEFGDTTLTGVGTAATGTFAGIAGSITVLEDINGAIVPVIIPITPDDVTFTLPSDPGITNWSLSFTVDIASFVPDATVAFLSFDNNLVASSEAGTSAQIQKKVVSGPSLAISVPEPGMALLILAASLGLAVRRRA